MIATWRRCRYVGRLMYVQPYFVEPYWRTAGGYRFHWCQRKGAWS
jgi:hypothetical protein